MDPTTVLDALRREAEALAEALTALPPDAWAAPTRCAPWTVRELFQHVDGAVNRLDGMLDAPAPPAADVSAAGYYRPDRRFAPEVNAARIDAAREAAAAVGDDKAQVDRFVATVSHAMDRCAAQPADRVVRTRHGDAMLLTDFLTTRVFELAVHGLDLADAVGREAWLTAPAAAVLGELLLGPDPAGSPADLGWDDAGFLRKATGRAPLDEAEREHVERLGLRWLTVG